MQALLLLQKIQSNTKLVSIRLGVLLSSLLCTLLDLGLPTLPPCRARVLGPTKQILWHDLHHKQHEQD